MFAQLSWREYLQFYILSSSSETLRVGNNKWQPEAKRGEMLCNGTWSDCFLMNLFVVLQLTRAKPIRAVDPNARLRWLAKRRTSTTTRILTRRHWKMVAKRMAIRLPFKQKNMRNVRKKFEIFKQHQKKLIDVDIYPTKKKQPRIVGKFRTQNEEGTNILNKQIFLPTHGKCVQIHNLRLDKSQSQIPYIVEPQSQKNPPQRFTPKRRPTFRCSNIPIS